MGTSTKKIILRIVFLAFASALLISGGGLAWMSSWKIEKLETLSSTSEIATTSAGPVEFLARGEGPPVIVFHGMPGGYDQAMLVGSPLIEAGFQVIAPSRPGYLRTPLTIGTTPAQQADVMATLLDSLGVQSVGVIGLDAGGPVALEFALRYPGRIWGLVLLSALTSRQVPGDPSGDGWLKKAANDKLLGDITTWGLLEVADYDPARALGWMMDQDSTLDAAARRKMTDTMLASPEQMDWLQDFSGTYVPLSARRDGLQNDLQNLQTTPDFPLSRFGASTFIIHGCQDGVAPLAEAQRLAGEIPNATSLFLEGAGHQLLLGPYAEEVNLRLAEFFQQHSGGQSQP